MNVPREPPKPDRLLVPVHAVNLKNVLFAKSTPTRISFMDPFFLLTGG
jgi:hypothetical protein